MDETAARRMEERRKRRQTKPKKHLQLDAVKIVARPDQLLLLQGQDSMLLLESTTRAADLVLEGCGLDLDFLSQDPVLLGALEEKKSAEEEEEKHPEKEAEEEPPIVHTAGGLNSDVPLRRQDSLLLKQKSSGEEEKKRDDEDDTESEDDIEIAQPRNKTNNAEPPAHFIGDVIQHEGGQGEARDVEEDCQQPQVPNENQKPRGTPDVAPQQNTCRKKSAMKSAMPRQAVAPPAAVPGPSLPEPDSTKVSLDSPERQNEWDTFFPALLLYKQCHQGSCNVPAAYADNPQLAQWVQRLREQCDTNTLSLSQMAALNEIGFVWSSSSSSSSTTTATTGGAPVAAAVITVPVPRMATTDRSALPPPTIKVTCKTAALQKKWDDHFAALLRFREENNGSCAVPTTHPKLGRWVSTSREFYKKNKLAEDKVAALEEVGFIWTTRSVPVPRAVVYNRTSTMSEAWLANVTALREYRDENDGNCAVPYNYPPNPRLGTWVSETRRLWKKGKLAQNKFTVLDEIGFVWDLSLLEARFQKIWDSHFEDLKEYHRKRGHCLVPQSFTGSNGLARWLSKQRNRFSKLRKKQQDKLLSLGVVPAPTQEELLSNQSVSKNPRKNQPEQKNRSQQSQSRAKEVIWEKRYLDLVEFHQKHGHIKVPIRYPDNPPLNTWLRHQRNRFAIRNAVQQRKLLELGVIPAPSQLKLLSADMTAVFERAQSTNRPDNSGGDVDAYDNISNIGEDTVHRQFPRRQKSPDGQGNDESDSETETETEDDMSVRPAKSHAALSYQYDYDETSHSSSDNSSCEWTSTKVALETSLLGRIEQNIDKQEEDLVLARIGDNIGNLQVAQNPPISQIVAGMSNDNEGDNERAEEDSSPQNEESIERDHELLEQIEINGGQEHPTSPLEGTTTGRQPIDDHQPSAATLETSVSETTGTTQAHAISKDHGSRNEPILLDDSSDDDSIVVSPMPSRNGRKRKLGALTVAPNIAHATTLVPKYLGAGGNPPEKAQKPFLTQHILDARVVVPFLIKNCKSSSSASATNTFKAKLKELDSDPTSYKLCMTGTAILLKAFRLFFEQWLKRQWWQQAFQDLLTDRLRIELDASIPREKFLEAWTRGSIREVSDNFSRSGLWVDLWGENKIATAFLEALLGENIIKNSTLAVAILKVENAAYKKDEWNEARKRFLQYKTNSIEVTLCIGGYGTLDGIDKSMIAGDLRRFDEAALPPEIQAGSQMDVSSIHQSVTSRKKSHTAFDEQPDDVCKAAAYRQFCIKYKAIYDFDYQRSEIGSKHVMSEMWNQHKVRYGLTCDEDHCQCARDIGFLCATIVESFISKQSMKDPKWHDEWSDTRYSRVGFANHFVTKFMPLLEEEYPKEAPFKIFRRLEAMWKLHLQQVLFGSHCVEECDCASGWQRVFRKGDVLDASPRQVGRKRLRAPAGDHAEMPRVPRKAPRTHHGRSIANITSETTDLAQNPYRSGYTRLETASITHKRYESLPRGTPPSQAGPLLDTGSFNLSFDTQRALGFYCVTDHRLNRRVCKIVSVDSRGATRKINTLVQKGTCVESIEFRQGPSFVSYPVAGHEELRNFYTHAKESMSELKVHFVNYKVQAVATGDSGRDWTFDGQWQGKLTKGWAGGATSKSYAASLFRKPQYASRPWMTAKTSLAGNIQHEATRAPSRRELLVFRRVAPGPSILMEPKHPRHNKQVSFKEGHVMRIIPPDKHRTQKIIMAGPETFVFSKDSGGEPLCAAPALLEDVSRALRENSQMVLLKLLSKGALRTDQVTEKGKLFVNEQYALAKAQKHEDVLKILRVYKAAANVNNHSLRAKAGHIFRIRIERIAGLSLTEEGRKQPNLDTIMCRVFNVNKSMKAKHLQKTRPMDFATEVIFGTGNAALPEYEIESYPGDGGSFLIEIHSATEKLKNPPKVSFSLAEISKHCQMVRTPTELDKHLHLKAGEAFFFPGGKVRLSVTKLPIEQHDTAVKDLKYVVDTIEKINSEIVSGQEKMSTDLREKHGLSILHAAISLAKPELVVGLLRHGANPTAQCTMGSPIHCARRLAILANDEARCAKFLSSNPTGAVRSCLLARRITNSSMDAECNEHYFEERAKNLKIICRELSRDSNSVPLVNSTTRATTQPRDAKIGGSPSIAHAASQNHVNRKEMALRLFLKSIYHGSRKDDPWRSMDSVSTHFYSILGREDNIMLRAAREAATEQGYVEWGKPDEDDDDDEEGAWGFMEVAPPTDSYFSDEMKASFRLNNRGQECISQLPEMENYTEVLAPLDGKSGEQSVATGHADKANTSTDRAQKTPSYDANLSVFLRSIQEAKTIDDKWVSMDVARDSFYKQFGKVDMEVFEANRATATAKRFIEWGGLDEDSWDWTVVNPVEVEDPKEACLKLSDNGRAFLSNPTAAPLIPHATAATLLQKRCECLADFLQCIARCATQANGWVEMNDLDVSFNEKYGVKSGDDDRARQINLLEMKRWCEEGTQEGCLIWGRPDPSRPGIFEPCTHLQVVGHAIGAVVKLTEKGLALATNPNASTERSPMDWWRSNVDAGLKQSYAEMAKPHQSAPKDPILSIHGEPNVSAAAPLIRTNSMAPRGRGRGRTLPAWMTQSQSDEADKLAGAAEVTATSSVARQQRKASDDETAGLGAGHNSTSAANHHSRRQNSTRFLHRHWFLPKNHSLCRHFRGASNIHCKFGHRCRFPHVQHPLSDNVLRSYTGPVKSLSQAHFQFECDGTLVTAVYQDPHTKIYYASQGGRRVNTCHDDGNADSVCWYANQEDAIHAVSAVYYAAASQPAPQHRRRQPHQPPPELAYGRNEFGRDDSHRPSKRQKAKMNS